jgi:hypothetical protein
MTEQAAALATIGKTEEQLAAERTAARWKAEAAKLAQANPSVCQGRVSNIDNWHGHQCQLKARFHREGRLDAWDQDSPMVIRQYCHQHDEVTKREKRAVKNAAERKEREAKWAAQDRAAERSALIGKAVGHLSNAQLVQLATFLQTQDGFRREGK